MKIQEKFDSIINCIERLVWEEDSDIPQTISRETGLNLRLLGDAFQFITDITLIKYIRQRRLVNALMRRNEFNLPIEQVASDAGFSDAAAFSKACKNEFNLSPSQITEIEHGNKEANEKDSFLLSSSWRAPWTSRVFF